jgi:hypothetical protein
MNNPFKGKNLNVFKPMYVALLILAIAGAQAYGWSWVDYGVFTVGQLRVTPLTIASVVLAAGVLIDSRK